MLVRIEKKTKIAFLKSYLKVNSNTACSNNSDIQCAFYSVGDNFNNVYLKK